MPVPSGKKQIHWWKNLVTLLTVVIIQWKALIYLLNEIQVVIVFFVGQAVYVTNVYKRTTFFKLLILHEIYSSQVLFHSFSCLLSLQKFFLYLWQHSDINNKEHHSSKLHQTTQHSHDTLLKNEKW